MPSVDDLEDWIREQYHTIGINRHGDFIGKKAFKHKLIAIYSADTPPKQEIRELVNR